MALPRCVLLSVSGLPSSQGRIARKSRPPCRAALEMKNGRFPRGNRGARPDTLLKLVLHNAGTDAEEFESLELKKKGAGARRQKFPGVCATAGKLSLLWRISTPIRPRAASLPAEQDCAHASQCLHHRLA